MAIAPLLPLFCPTKPPFSATEVFWHSGALQIGLFIIIIIIILGQNVLKTHANKLSYLP